MDGQTSVQEVAIDETQDEVNRIINASPVCNQNKTIQCGRSCGEYFVCYASKSFSL